MAGYQFKTFDVRWELGRPARSPKNLAAQKREIFGTISDNIATRSELSPYCIKISSSIGKRLCQLPTLPYTST